MTVIETEVPPLELVGVRAAYGGIEVLHGIDLALAAGEVLALLGANGAGKSTTVKVCAGLLRPTAGAVRVAGHDVTGAPSHELARIGVCTIPEGRGVFPNLTVRAPSSAGVRRPPRAATTWSMCAWPS